MTIDALTLTDDLAGGDRRQNLRAGTDMSAPACDDNRIPIVQGGLGWRLHLVRRPAVAIDVRPVRVAPPPPLQIEARHPQGTVLQKFGMHCERLMANGGGVHPSKIGNGF